MPIKRPLYIPFAGPALLETPLLNKGSAFSEDERLQFNLEGLLPHHIETIDQQAERAYEQFKAYKDDIEKHIYLRNIQDTNETLYFRLIANHLEEFMPLIYTPTVGKACQQFSKIYRRKRGLFISYPNRHLIDDMLQNATKQNVKVIVVTDSERILGLGDQGIGGMGIPIGKLALYTACGGISPAYTLPVVLDVGTNNQELLSDPMYMGWRHERITGDEYYDFIDSFIQAVKQRWPDVLLQFEDFAQAHATPLLQRYRDELCCFNDDIQGTAAVTVGTLLAACKAKGERLRDQCFVFVGAGSAGCGIAEQVIAQMMAEGLSDDEARQKIFMVNRYGLIELDAESSEGLMDFQLALAQSKANLADYGLKGHASLLEVVTQVKPSVMIGVSGQPGLFTQDVVESMYRESERPIILPLSNPTSRIEGHPKDILAWTEGKAIIATGSPIDPVDYNGDSYAIAQCNNSYIFPGIGLGVLASRAKRVTNSMLMVASRALAESSPMVRSGEGDLLPAIADIQSVSRDIAKQVAAQAVADAVALQVPDDALLKAIDKNFWSPEYRSYRRTSF